MIDTKESRVDTVFGSSKGFGRSRQLQSNSKDQEVQMKPTVNCLKSILILTRFAALTSISAVQTAFAQAAVNVWAGAIPLPIGNAYSSNPSPYNDSWYFFEVQTVFAHWYQRISKIFRQAALLLSAHPINISRRLIYTCPSGSYS